MCEKHDFLENRIKGINLKKNKGHTFIAIMAIAIAAAALGGCSAPPQVAQTVQTTREVVQEATTTTVPKEEVPKDIEKSIEEADAFFQSGQYADAQQKYRKTEMAIKASSDLSSSKKEELLVYVVKQKDAAAEITATARIHFGNAMMLQYEKRFEDALEELGLALKAYPKYQDAIDALDSLEAMMGLSG
jgi:tetratricopeptide (TPR) repeat protein